MVYIPRVEDWRDDSIRRKNKVPGCFPIAEHNRLRGKGFVGARIMTKRGTCRKREKPTLK